MKVMITHPQQMEENNNILHSNEDLIVFPFFVKSLPDHMSHVCQSHRMLLPDIIRHIECHSDIILIISYFHLQRKIVIFYQHNIVKITLY